MDKFIKNKYGSDDGRKETKNENYEHLIIVTDGKVNIDSNDEIDQRVQQYRFVSTYIIGRGEDKSVSCPFSRGCPGETSKIEQIGNEKIQASLSKEDQQALNNIDSINNWNSYGNLFISKRAKCLCRNTDEELKDKLNNLKNRIKDSENEEVDFIIKFNNLYRIVDSQIHNVKNVSTAD